MSSNLKYKSKEVADCYIMILSSSHDVPQPVEETKLLNDVSSCINIHFPNFGLLNLKMGTLSRSRVRFN